MNRRKAVGPATEYIAGELRAQRARLGWTFDDVEKNTGVPRSTAERASRGDSAIPVEVLVQLCIGMGLDAGEVLNGSVKASGGKP